MLIPMALCACQVMRAFSCTLRLPNQTEMPCSLEYGIVEEKQHFLVDTKQLSPMKDGSVVADIFYLNPSCQCVVNVYAQVSVRVNLGYNHMY